MTHDYEPVEDESGWKLPLDGSGVSQLLIDYRDTLRLGNGTDIIIETPFGVRGDDGEFLIDPADKTQLTPAPTLVHQIIRSAVVSNAGRVVDHVLRPTRSRRRHSGRRGELASPVPERPNARRPPGGDVAVFPPRGDE